MVLWWIYALWCRTIVRSIGSGLPGMSFSTFHAISMATQDLMHGMIDSVMLANLSHS